MIKTILVTGANKGIGLEFCRQLKSKNYQVIAVCRKVSPELADLGVEIYDNVDVTKQGDLQDLAKNIKDKSIDILINNAGIAEFENSDAIDFSSIERQFQVNALGPLKVYQALKNKLSDAAKVAMITSRMGSIKDNTSGEYYGYRISKTALNMAAITLNLDLKKKGQCVGLFHPGFVQTSMTGMQGSISPKESVVGLLERIFELNVENSGRFIHMNGGELDW